MKIDTQKLLENKKYCKKIFRFFLKLNTIRPDTQRLFQKHINKALKNLEFSNFLLEEHKYSIKKKLPGRTFYEWCITIYYYALYHAALALLTKAGYESKNHLATIASITLFYYHKSNTLQKDDIEFLIRKISIDRKDIDLVLDSKELREKACYGTDETFELNQTLVLQKETADFVNKIRLLLA